MAFNNELNLYRIVSYKRSKTDSTKLIQINERQKKYDIQKKNTSTELQAPRSSWWSKTS